MNGHPGRGLKLGFDPARVAARLAAAGLGAAITVETVQAARVFLGGVALLAALAASPSAPGRTGLAVLIGAPLAASLLPEALLLRAASRRRRAFVEAMPDALDLLAVSVSAGRSVRSGFADAIGTGHGPLARELGIVVAEMEAGTSQAVAMEGLRRRIGGPEVGALCASLERSRTLGSPLAELLRSQAGALRVERRREIEDRAARAAPKIQLVIALVLVPSVMLMLLAALVANAGSLLVGFA